MSNSLWQWVVHMSTWSILEAFPLRVWLMMRTQNGLHFDSIYRLPPWLLSFRKEEPLRLSPQTPVSSYSWPRRTQVADKVVSPSCYRSSPPPGPFSWCPLCHSSSPPVVLNRAMCPAHLCIPFLITMMSFTPVWCRIIIIIKLYIDILMTCRLE